jgi:hypothetical protein
VGKGDTLPDGREGISKKIKKKALSILERVGRVK